MIQTAHPLGDSVKITAFSVEKYRSIKTAQKLPIGNLTILVGPNNEGKSNLLRAMVLGMLALSRHGRVSGATGISRGQRFHRPRAARTYEWVRDFPVDLQDSQPNGRTILDFEFQLTDHETDAFRSEIGSDLNGVLPIRVYLSESKVPEFKVTKRGRGALRLLPRARQSLASSEPAFVWSMFHR